MPKKKKIEKNIICKWCDDTGQCFDCNGTGECDCICHKRLRNTGECDQDCCNDDSGICSECNGTGKCECQRLENVG